MLQIKKLRDDHVLDFAAEELKKYLRMMMPHCGDISIEYQPDAKDGFRLGLLSDFNLPSEAKDPVLDDVIHIDTESDGGILAGSNSRSVLFSVYRLLRENGCRWLYPGIDGEYIPVKNIAPTKYHKLADHRFRGHCNEGAESQQCMLETIDFYAKLELNVYMIEFDVPYFYYNSYYSHKGNVANRPPEPVSPQQVLQWKRQCEVEIAKRGLEFHDMGHGWTAEPFGLSSTDGWSNESKQEISEEQRQYLAMLNGVRGLRNGVALNTNVCMSNPVVRTKMVKSILTYAKEHQNVDFLHVWLADGNQGHCECEECQKGRPSDFYVLMLNELDEELTKAGLPTKIVFIAYVDTLFAPDWARLKNTNRFSLLYAPIYRSYSASIPEHYVLPDPIPYVRNNWQRPKSALENMALLRQWQKVWDGPAYSYEYHYWRAQYNDPGILYISRRIYEDIIALKYMGLDGFVEDGSQRSFFPNGFHMYIFAEALMNRDCDYDAVLEDYFSHIYGDAWKEVRDYLQKVSDAFDYPYMSGERSADPAKGNYYNPEMVKKLSTLKEIAAQGRAIAEGHLSMEDRPKTVSMRLLLRHAEYVEHLGAVMTEMAKGNREHAVDMFHAFVDEFGKYEFEIERYFDHFLMSRSISVMIDPPKVVIQEGL